MRRALGLLGAAAVIGGCGGGGSSDEKGSEPAAAARTVTVQRTEVIGRSSGTGTRGFDASSIYEQDAPGVVTVIALYGSGSVSAAGGGSEGSGFVLNSDGEVATNAHVVTQGTGSSITRAKQVYVKFTDRNQVPARIVGYDPNEDVALLKVDPKGLTLRPLPLGSSAGVKVGAPVAAIGSPFGEEGSLSTGIISATDRSIESLTRFQISGAIQTDAAINHGNSGGPLVDSSGRVVGINSQIESSSDANSGVGFAIPIDQVRRSLDALRRDGKVEYAYLGVSTNAMYPQLARRLGLPVDRGAQIVRVVRGGPADRAGLKGDSDRITFQGFSVPRDSDVITAVDGRQVLLDDDLGRILDSYRPGQRVKLTVVRGSRRRTVTLTLGRRPGEVGP